MIRIFIALLLVVTTGVDGAANLDSLVNSGLKQSYDFEFDKSSNTFNEVITNYPDYPEGYFYLSQIHLWFYLGSRDDGQLRTFEKYTELAYEKCDDVISNHGETAYYMELMGNLALQEAMVEASEENTLSAFWATKSAYGYFEDALELDSNYYRAYLGLGLLEYALSYVPGMFKWAIDITGLGRDKEKGFEFVFKSYQNAADPIAKTESAFHLAKMLAEFKGQPDSAAVLLKELVSKYPRNLIFKYQLALALIDCRDLDSAAIILKEIIRYQDKRFIQTIAFSYFLMGEVSFRQNLYSEAIKYYEDFLNVSRGFEYSGIAYYNTALSYMLLDDSINTKKYLVLARNGNSDISDDLYAARRSKILYNAVKDSSFKLLIISRNNLHAANYSVVVDKLEPVLDTLSGDNLVEAQLILAEAYLFNGNYNLSDKTLKGINPDKITEEDWLRPYYYYLHALNDYRLGSVEEANKKLSIAFDLNDYDFKEKILAKLNYVKSLLENHDQNE